jgi:hypothetical protein
VRQLPATGIGLVVIDIVTSRQANLHDELVALLGHGEALTFPGNPRLYAVSYRPGRSREADRIDAWVASFAVGDVLPTLPLALRGGPCLPLDLEVTYMEARQKSRLGGPT